MLHATSCSGPRQSGYANCIDGRVKSASLDSVDADENDTGDDLDDGDDDDDSDSDFCDLARPEGLSLTLFPRNSIEPAARF